MSKNVGNFIAGGILLAGIGCLFYQLYGVAKEKAKRREEQEEDEKRLEDEIVKDSTEKLMAATKLPRKNNAGITDDFETLSGLYQAVCSSFSQYKLESNNSIKKEELLRQARLEKAKFDRGYFAYRSYENT